MKRLQVLLIFFVLSSCYFSRTVYNLINQKDIYYWTGEAATETYDLFVDSSYESIWFNGRLIKNSKDTFYLHGFEKGNNHPTGMRTVLKDSLHQSYVGHVFIWTIGWNSDSIEIVNNHDSLDLMPVNLVLYKKAKQAE